MYAKYTTKFPHLAFKGHTIQNQKQGISKANGAPAVHSYPGGGGYMSLPPPYGTRLGEMGLIMRFQRFQPAVTISFELGLLFNYSRQGYRIV